MSYELIKLLNKTSWMATPVSFQSK